MYRRWMLFVAPGLALGVTVVLTSLVLAATFTLSGRVTDQTGTGIVGATVEALQPGTTSVVTSTTTGANGAYSLSLDAGTYDVRVTPPSSSGFQSTLILSQVVTSDKTLNAILIPISSNVTLTGKVRDASGVAMSNQTLWLTRSGFADVSAQTNASGQYTFQVASGTYGIRVEGNSFSYGSNAYSAPGNYVIRARDFVLSQSTVMDIPLPAKRVNVHVQDASGGPVAGISVTSDGVANDSLFLGPLPAYEAYSFQGNPVTTNDQGNAVVWLFPTKPGGQTYTFTATPPAGSAYAVFNVGNIAFTAETSLVFALQFVHASPVTTASFNPPAVNGIYTSSPVTATLSATAASSFTVASTKYTVNNGPEQTYTGPFPISGDGTHTLRYWSVDNLGVFETSKTETIQIQTSTPTPTPTLTPTAAPTDTPKPTSTTTNTPVPTDTPTPTATATDTPVPTDTPTPTITPTNTLVPTETPTPTFTPTSTATATNTPTNTPPPVAVLTSLLISPLVSPPTATVAVNGTLQMAANGTYSDGSTRDVASIVTWTSDAPGIASVSSSGLVTGVSIGFANVTATLDGVTSNVARIEVISDLRIITSSTLTAGTVGAPYSAIIEATGGTPPYYWTLEPGSSLPAGLTLSNVNNTAVISGTPTVAGNYSFTLRVTDSSQVTTTRRFVIPAPPPQPCTVGQDCSTGGGSGGGGGGIISSPQPDCTNFALAPGSGPLPPGVTLDPATGRLIGTPTSGGTFQVTVQCTYNVNQVDTQNFTLTINNPTPLLMSLSPSSALEDGPGFPLTVQGSGFVQGSTVYWNGTPRTTTTVGSALLPTQLQAVISVSDIAAPMPVSVTVVNAGPGGGTSNALPFTITASIQPPVVDAGGPYAPGQEGGTVPLNGSVTDPGETPTYLWTYTLGAGVDAGASCTFSSANSPATSFSCTDDGVFEVKLTATRSQSATGSDTATVTLANVKPNVSITAPASGSLYPVGTTVNFAGAFTDPGRNDTHTAEWAVDGVDVAGSVNPNDKTVTGSRAFTAAGVYRVKLTVTDDDNGSGEATTVGDIDALVVVYDPNGGFVTGGGWFNSPSGACLLSSTCQGANGKANFGFVSKYHQGATTPSGQTEFQFKAGNLNFHSSTYEWLVVAGPKAQYKGTGTINGSGNYGFMLTATDGQVNGGGGIDKFRIKIWDKNNGDAIVYDNQMGTADDAQPATSLGGGSIVVHKD